MHVIGAIVLAVIATANATPVPNDTTTRQQNWTTQSVPAGDVPASHGPCRLTTTNPYIHNQVHHLLTVDRRTLINYVLNFSNYSHNPLTISMAGVYDAKKWSRVTTAHGQTLLSLAFNYGILSMMTLTLGTEDLHIELQDWPPGCFAEGTDKQKVRCI